MPRQSNQGSSLRASCASPRVGSVSRASGAGRLPSVEVVNLGRAAEGQGSSAADGGEEDGEEDDKEMARSGKEEELTLDQRMAQDAEGSEASDAEEDTATCGGGGEGCESLTRDIAPYRVPLGRISNPKARQSWIQAKASYHEELFRTANRAPLAEVRRPHCRCARRP